MVFILHRITGIIWQSHHAKPSVMFKNYLTTAIRNLQRNRIYSAINILGLSFGLACAMLITLYVKDEVSFDRFHEKKDQVYRVTGQVLDEKGHEAFKVGKTGMIEGPSFKQEVPEVSDFVRLSKWEYVVRKGNQTFNQAVMYADDLLFISNSLHQLQRMIHVCEKELLLLDLLHLTHRSTLVLCFKKFNK